jgi:hypothetical protein
LKKTILHRKNSLFYKTVHGALIGDIFMSLIHTCTGGHRSLRLSGGSPEKLSRRLQEPSKLDALELSSSFARQHALADRRLLRR